MAKCEYLVVVYQDADGRDLCESLDLPCYPAYECGAPLAVNSNMCEEHDPWADHWD